MTDVNGWTLKTLKEYVDSNITAQEKAVAIALEAQKNNVQLAKEALEKSFEKSEISNNHRFESVNELRKTLADQATLFVTKREAEADHRALESRMIELVRSLKESVLLAQTSLEKSVIKSEHSLEARFASVNESRESLRDQTKAYLTKDEYGRAHIALRESLDAHILNETQRVQAQDERLDGRLHAMKEDVGGKALQKEVDNITKRQDSNSKWLFGMIAALFVSIILTVVDIATRFIR